jgi:hypothetical protein
MAKKMELTEVVAAVVAALVILSLVTVKTLLYSRDTCIIMKINAPIKNANSNSTRIV